MEPKLTHEVTIFLIRKLFSLPFLLEAASGLCLLVLHMEGLIMLEGHATAEQFLLCVIK